MRVDITDVLQVIRDVPGEPLALRNIKPGDLYRLATTFGACVPARAWLQQEGYDARSAWENAAQNDLDWYIWAVNTLVTLVPQVRERWIPVFDWLNRAETRQQDIWRNARSKWVQQIRDIDNDPHLTTRQKAARVQKPHKELEKIDGFYVPKANRLRHRYARKLKTLIVFED